MKLAEGAYPVLPNEALLNNSAMEQCGLSIGSTVLVTIPDGMKQKYKITGSLEDTGSLQKADVYGMVLSEEGFRSIADENAAEGTTYRIQFKSGANVQHAITEIKENYGLSDHQISENTALLGLTGQSKNSLMQSLYLVAVSYTHLQAFLTFHRHLFFRFGTCHIQPRIQGKQAQKHNSADSVKTAGKPAVCRHCQNRCEKEQASPGQRSEFHLFCRADKLSEAGD